VIFISRTPKLLILAQTNPAKPDFVGLRFNWSRDDDIFSRTRPKIRFEDRPESKRQYWYQLKKNVKGQLLKVPDKLQSAILMFTPLNKYKFHTFASQYRLPLTLLLASIFYCPRQRKG